MERVWLGDEGFWLAGESMATHVMLQVSAGCILKKKIARFVVERGGTDV
jgi:hypothetical protein